MTREDVEYLQTSEAAKWIERYLSVDPLKAALEGVPTVICTQIKYLQRCRQKLPLFYENRWIVPPLAFEQCSSWKTAEIKHYTGNNCVDMTCGLGIDALHFSRFFNQVTALERDPVLCEVARYNFSRLGIRNITVLCEDASKWVKQEKSPIDLVYMDPARRKEGRKVVLFEDCSPNAKALMPFLLHRANRIVIKASPLFDVDEAFRCFSVYGMITVKVVSIQNECKELLIDITPGRDKKEIIGNDLVDKDGKLRDYEFIRRKFPFVSVEQVNDFQYVGIADVAFYKSRTFLNLMKEHFPDGVITGDMGIALWKEYPEGFPGRLFRIKNRFKYKPKEIAQYLKKAGMKRITILKQSFPVPVERIKKELKITDGDEGILLCTEKDGELMVLEVENI